MKADEIETILAYADDVDPGELQKRGGANYKKTF